MRPVARIWLFVLFPAAIFTGCSTGPKYIVKDYQAPRRVAVLPFTNQTNDVGGPETVRKLLIEMLPSRGYYPIDMEQVDKVLLEEFGITQGGQLPVIGKQELGNSLGVDGLFFGDLITFVDFPFGFGRKRTVKANLKLYDAKTETLIWEDEKGWTTPEIHLSAKEAKRAAVKQIADRQIKKMKGTFLREESVAMLERALRTLPLGK